jgi:hypothetical protein
MASQPFLGTITSKGYGSHRNPYFVRPPPHHSCIYPILPGPVLHPLSLINDRFGLASSRHGPGYNLLNRQRFGWRTGSVTVTSVPFPSVLRTSMSPWWRLMMP